MNNRLSINESEDKTKSTSVSSQKAKQYDFGPFDDFPEKDDDIWPQKLDSPIA